MEGYSSEEHVRAMSSAREEGARMWEVGGAYRFHVLFTCVSSYAFHVCFSHMLLHKLFICAFSHVLLHMIFICVCMCFMSSAREEGARMWEVGGAYRRPGAARRHLTLLPSELLHLQRPYYQ